MNTRLMLQIPFRTEELDENGQPSFVNRVAKLTVDTLLDPMYVSESALLSLFVDEEEYPKYQQKAREIAFNSSVRAWEWARFKLPFYEEEQKVFYLREMALCLAMNAFAKHFYKGFQDSLHRSKTYGEFTVTTTVKNSPRLLEAMIKESNDCLEAIKKDIEHLTNVVNGLGMHNLKGIHNPSNPLTWRVWFNNNLPERSREIFASEKVWYHGNVYKGGIKDVLQAIPISGTSDRGRAAGLAVHRRGLYSSVHAVYP